MSFAVDTILFFPALTGAELAVENLTSEDSSLLATIGSRLLLVAQAIICLVTLPFQLLLTIGQGLWTIYGDGSLATTAENLIRLGAYTLAVPACALAALTTDGRIKEIGNSVRASLANIQQAGNGEFSLANIQQLFADIDAN